MAVPNTDRSGPRLQLYRDLRSGEVVVMSLNIRQHLVDMTGDTELLFADGLDGAIIGVSQAFSEPRVVYSVSAVLAILMADHDPDPDGDDPYVEAREHFDFNIGGAYVGPRTPIWVEDEYLKGGYGEEGTTVTALA